MLKVEDVMTRDVVTVAPDLGVEDVMWELASKGVSGAPVRDATGHVLGLVTKSDIADPRRPSRVLDATAQEIMTPLVFAVSPDDSLMDAAKRMIETGNHRLVVVSADGRVVGILSTIDVLRAFVSGRL